MDLLCFKCFSFVICDCWLMMLFVLDLVCVYCSSCRVLLFWFWFGWRLFDVYCYLFVFWFVFDVCVFLCFGLGVCLWIRVVCVWFGWLLWILLVVGGLLLLDFAFNWLFGLLVLTVSWWFCCEWCCCGMILWLVVLVILRW